MILTHLIYLKILIYKCIILKYVLVDLGFKFYFLKF